MNTELFLLHVETAFKVFFFFLFIFGFPLLLRRLFLRYVGAKLGQNEQLFLLLRLFYLSFVFHVEGDSQAEKISRHFLLVLVNRRSLIEDLHEVCFGSPRMRVDPGCFR